MWPGPSVNGRLLCRGCALWWSAWTHKTITLVMMHRVDEECSLSSTQSSMELSPTGMKLVQQEIFTKIFCFSCSLNSISYRVGGRRWRVSLWCCLISDNLDKYSKYINMYLHAGFIETRREKVFKGLVEKHDVSMLFGAYAGTIL